jgi:hypothetical protein
LPSLDVDGVRRGRRRSKRHADSVINGDSHPAPYDHLDGYIVTNLDGDGDGDVHADPDGDGNSDVDRHSNRDPDVHFAVLRGPSRARGPSRRHPVDLRTGGG